jgi:Skp family chaperone for outer membrane proteins
VKNKEIEKLLAMFEVSEGLGRERFDYFFISRNLGHQKMDEEFKKKQEEAEKKYEELVVLTDKLEEKINNQIEKIKYEQAEEIFR